MRFHYNARRFVRYELEIQIWLRYKRKVVFLDDSLATSGFNYFSPLIKAERQAHHQQVIHFVQQLKQHPKEIEEAIRLVQQKQEKFFALLEFMNLQRNPRAQEGYLQLIRSLIAPVDFAILGANPKSLALFEQLDEKIVIYANYLHQVVSHSKQGQIYPIHFHQDFAIDASISQVRVLAGRSPFAQALVLLYDALELGYDIFRNMVEDVVLEKNPELWKKQWVELSEGGILFHTKWDLEKREPLIIHYNASVMNYKTQRKDIWRQALEARIVSVKSHVDSYAYACQFDYPNLGATHQIANLIQLAELDEAQRFGHF